MIKSRPTIWLVQDNFGSFTDQTGTARKVKRFTWTNYSNVSIQVINYGGTITSIKVPDRKGNVQDIVTGFDTIDEYLGPQNGYYGATIGRVANRIANGEMNVEGVDYKLATNDGRHHLHGGIQGFDKVLWDYHVKGTKLILTYLSPDKEECYPGDVLTTLTYQLTPNNEFQMDFKAVVSKPTPINLTNHSYFNLGGHGCGPEALYQHEFTINADKYTEVDDTLMPTGKLLDVSGTAFDLRVPRLLGDLINKVPKSPGFDHNFCITKESDQDVVFISKVHHPPSGRVMEVYSNQPGVQFYTGNFMPEDDSSRGKGAVYKKHGAFCLEPQVYPDAIHHANFPKVLVYPGEEYHHFIGLKFLVQNE